MAWLKLPETQAALAVLREESKPLRDIVINQRPIISADGLAFVLLRNDAIGEIRGLERLETLINARKSVLESKLKLSNDPVGKAIDEITRNQPTD